MRRYRERRVARTLKLEKNVDFARTIMQTVSVPNVISFLLLFSSGANRES